ncbi:Nse4 C-terminal-domain-containing protein [Chytriomyces sp. MP71]|nr:Nse4 C-terminal-domain-containing protein [Chytriomyces sp. MP71]
MAPRARRTIAVKSDEVDREAGMESSDDEFANATQKKRNQERARAAMASEAGEDEEDGEDEEGEGDDDEEDFEDEEQSKEAKRRLRREYRLLQMSMDENAREWVTSDSTGLKDTLVKTNELFEQVTTTQEAYLDSKVLTTVAKLSVNKVNNMKLSGRSVSIADFLRRVKRKLDPNPPALGRQNAPSQDEDGRELVWTQMEALILSIGVKAPTIEFIYGPLAVEPKVRKEVKRTAVRINKDAAMMQKPQQLQESDIQKQENETSKCVKDIKNILKAHKSMNFFEFAINPTSFSQSVENVFYISFLIRDGVVALEIEDGQPILHFLDVDAGECDGGEKKQQKQHIVELTRDMFDDIIETYELTETVIPTRRYPDAQAGGSKWY